MNRTSETSIAKIELLPNNLFQITVKKQAVVDIAAAKQLIYATNDLLVEENPLRGGIFDITNIDHISDEARAYLSDNPEVKGTVTGVALISDSLIGKMIGNLFITVDGPTEYPVKFFDSSIRAEHWVRQQMALAQNLTLKN